MKRLIASILVLFALAALPGCQVAPGSDPVLVRAEQGTQAAYTTIDGFLTAEKANHDLIVAKYPSVHAVAVTLRQEYPKAQAEMVALINDYRKTKSADAATAIQAKQDLLAKLAADAAAALLKFNQKKAG